MRKVLIESPYSGSNDRVTDANVKYGLRCMADCFKRGEAPFAGHLLYTLPGVLDDKVLRQRRQGMAAALLWGQEADYTVVYTDRGISEGMEEGIKRAKEQKRPIEYRSLDGKEE